MSNAGAQAHSRRYSNALHWAAELHRHQWRKGKPVPYIAHLVAVSALAWEDGGTENQAIDGLLHDAIVVSPTRHRTAEVSNLTPVLAFQVHAIG